MNENIVPTVSGKGSREDPIIVKTPPPAGREAGSWHCKFKLEKRDGDINACKTPEERAAFLATEPMEIIHGEDNCMLNSGLDEVWDLVSGVVAQADHIFDHTDTTIGVGDSATAATASQIDLQAASNKKYNAMEVTYPLAASDQKIVCKSSFGSAEANYVWNEWVIKQSVSGKCLNRKVEGLGTKVAGSTWTLEVSITLS